MGNDESEHYTQTSWGTIRNTHKPSRINHSKLEVNGHDTAGRDSMPACGNAKASVLLMPRQSYCYTENNKLEVNGHDTVGRGSMPARGNAKSVCGLLPR